MTVTLQMQLASCDQKHENMKRILDETESTLLHLVIHIMKSHFHVIRERTNNVQKCLHEDGKKVGVA